VSRAEALPRDLYRRWYPLETRWSDNDVYGHINNVIYYSYIDSAVNRFLIEDGGLDIHAGDTVGFVVSSGCDYLAPAAYPEALEAGLRVAQLGTSSVRYGVGIFRRGEPQPCAQGFSVHVFVSRSSQRPQPMPAPLREALASILVD
jgi:acyl-CoA thioester hydrolase